MFVPVKIVNVRKLGQGEQWRNFVTSSALKYQKFLNYLQCNGCKSYLSRFLLHRLRLAVMVHVLTQFDFLGSKVIECKIMKCTGKWDQFSTKPLFLPPFHLFYMAYTWLTISY